MGKTLVMLHTLILFIGKGNQIAANIQPYCGGYGPAGEGSYADALIVQSLETANGAAFDVYSNICGQMGFSTIAATQQTLCSKKSN